MKYPSLSLFKLIKSLSKSEKRYLKLGLIDRETEHIKLLNAIEEQDIYDEEALKRAYVDDAFTKNIAVYKSYLYKYILRRLSQYRENSEEAAIFERIRFSDILIGKKLYKQAGKQLRSARKLAARQEASELSLLVFKKQRELLAQMGKPDFEVVRELYGEQKKAIASIDLNTEYTLLFNRISHLQIRVQKAYNSEEIRAMAAWREHPLLNVSVESLSLENSVLFLKSLAIYHFTKGEILEASRYNKQLLTLLETETIYNKRHPEQYICILNNYIIDQLSLKNITAFEAGLQQLEALPDNPAFQQVENIEARIFHQRFLLLFNYCFSEKEYGKAIAEMFEFRQQFERYQSQLQKHQRLTLYYLAAVLNFSAKNYKDAQTWLTPILQETKEDVVQEIFRYARLLNLIIHLELGNDEYLYSLLPVTQRALSRQTEISQSEGLILKFLRKTVAAASRKERTELRMELREGLVEARSQPGEGRLFTYVPVLEWV